MKLKGQKAVVCGAGGFMEKLRIFVDVADDFVFPISTYTYF